MFFKITQLPAAFFNHDVCGWRNAVKLHILRSFFIRIFSTYFIHTGTVFPRWVMALWHSASGGIATNNLMSALWLWFFSLFRSPLLLSCLSCRDRGLKQKSLEGAIVPHVARWQQRILLSTSNYSNYCLLLFHFFELQLYANYFYISFHWNASQITEKTNFQNISRSRCDEVWRMRLFQLSVTHWIIQLNNYFKPS